MEGQGTTYGFTLSVLLHIALCICVVGCLTWLGNVREQTCFGSAIHLVRRALVLWHHCSDCFCLLCYVICCFGGIKPPQGCFNTPKGVVLTRGVVVSPQRGGLIPLKSGHKTTRGGFKGGFVTHLGVVLWAYVYAQDQGSQHMVL